MKENLTELVVIMDMSGSMYSLTSDTIGGYNALIDEQKKQEGEAKVTTVLFNNKYKLLHNGVNIKDVQPLTGNDYLASGTTAMLDAVGKTIVDIGRKLANTPEEERPSTVMVTIITDGYENASVEYDWKTVQTMIKEQREKYNWLFTFIGANIDTKEVSENLGIDSRLAKSYTASKAGTDSVYKSMSKTMSYARACYSAADSCDEAVEEMSKMMDDIK